MRGRGGGCAGVARGDLGGGGRTTRAGGAESGGRGRERAVAQRAVYHALPTRRPARRSGDRVVAAERLRRTAPGVGVVLAPVGGGSQIEAVVGVWVDDELELRLALRGRGLHRPHGLDQAAVVVRSAAPARTRTGTWKRAASRPMSDTKFV